MIEPSSNNANYMLRFLGGAYITIEHERDKGIVTFNLEGAPQMNADGLDHMIQLLVSIKKDMIN